MLSAIWSVLHPYLLEIFKQKIDERAKGNKWKRSTIGEFMTLYDSLFELEEASRAVYGEFADIGLNGGAIARTIVTSRLERLGSAARTFVTSARRVHSLLSIYDDELAIALTGAREIKRKAWCELEAWVDALPSNLDDEQRLVPVIRFSKVIPTKRFASMLGQQLDYPALSQAALAEQGDAVKKRILQKLRTEHSDILDLRDKAALLAQLDILSNTIDEIAAVRVHLARFIKDAYSIEKIME